MVQLQTELLPYDYFLIPESKLSQHKIFITRIWLILFFVKLFNIA